MADVFFYVQHLFGIGHLRRSVAIANGLARHGIAVQLVSGGNPVANMGIADNHNIELLQLPLVRARDGVFSDLVNEHNNPVDEKWWSFRQQRLMDLWMASSAAILITESYPFARRVMRRELLPLLEASRGVAFSKLNVCSVRDIPQPKSKPSRMLEVGQILAKHYDHVLVHGDREVATLQETFPDIENERSPVSVHYTGYVDTDSIDSVASQTITDVLVSAGGGAAGLQLYRVALEAAEQDPGRLWRLLVGPNIVDTDFSALVARKSDNVIIERNRTDFRPLLMASSVSISQAGYNTLVDILRTGVAAVLVPYAKGEEQEQTIRAQKFSSAGRLVLLEEDALNSTSLLKAVVRAKQLHDGSKGSGSLATSPGSPTVEGVDQTAQLVGQWLNSL